MSLTKIYVLEFGSLENILVSCLSEGLQKGSHKAMTACGELVVAKKKSFLRKHSCCLEHFAHQRSNPGVRCRMHHKPIQQKYKKD